MLCQKYRYQKQKEPIIEHEKPTEPWRKVGTDLFHLNGQDYLLMIDYHSNYPKIALLVNTKSENVVANMKSVFARHGLPEIVISDNARQYDCQEFKDMAEKYGFKHITSSPRYPQSNGLAEKGVQIVKRWRKEKTHILLFSTTGPHH